MTKRDFNYRILKFIPKDGTIWIEDEPPIYWWEKTHTVVLRCGVKCFFTHRGMYDRPTATRFMYLAYPRSKRAALKVVKKFRKWMAEIRPDIRILQ